MNEIIRFAGLGDMVMPTALGQAIFDFGDDPGSANVVKLSDVSLPRRFLPRLLRAGLNGPGW